MFRKETIAAISTALTPSGIGIVRITGPEAILVGDKVFHGKHKLIDAAANTVHYGHIIDGDETIDEVLITILRAPHSFTAEDTVEINCHGGPFVMKKILDLVIRNGAELAEPGEFTKKAFLNGRIDLTQAEAVGELISSKNEIARKSSIDKLSGKASSDIKEIRENILYEMAFIEAAMDDPEHISIEGCSERLSSKILTWKDKINRLLENAERGRVISEGINTVLIGKPNVGKSSVMNLLLGEERAIVTDIKGTTRDTLEEQLNWDGMTLNIIDTAGIRETNDPVEKIGVDRAVKAQAKADLVLLIADAFYGIDEEDLKLEQECFNNVPDAKVIALFNKIDLNKEAKYGKWGEKAVEVIPFSTKTGDGMEVLRKTIKNLFYSGAIYHKDENWFANSRQKLSLEEVYKSLSFVEESIENGMPEDMYTIDLADAYRQLGYILGEEVEDELVDKIFSEFCMGK